MTQTEATVRQHIVVDAPIGRTFTVFTERFGPAAPPLGSVSPLDQTLGTIFNRYGGQVTRARLLL
jgi:hypothetical protein